MVLLYGAFFVLNTSFIGADNTVKIAQLLLCKFHFSTNKTIKIYSGLPFLDFDFPPCICGLPVHFSKEKPYL